MRGDSLSKIKKIKTLSEEEIKSIMDDIKYLSNNRVKYHSSKIEDFYYCNIMCNESNKPASIIANREASIIANREDSIQDHLYKRQCIFHEKEFDMLDRVKCNSCNHKDSVILKHLKNVTELIKLESESEW